MNKGFYNRFVKIRGTPREIALGLGMGVCIGMTPTMGFQIVIVIFLAALLKWSKIAAAAGVFVTNPLTAPFIYGFTFVVGSKVLRLEHHSFRFPDELNIDVLLGLLKTAPRILAALTVGGLIVGIPLGIASGVLAYIIISRNRERRGAVNRKMISGKKPPTRKKANRYPYKRKKKVDS